MALRFSTGLRNFLQGYGSLQQAMWGGCLKIYTGSQPASADSAVSGTLLCTVTLASGALTNEVLSAGTVTLTGGGSGSVDTLTVNSVEIMGSATSFDTSLTNTAALIAAKCNRRISTPDYIVTSSGAVITITAMPGTGTTPNGYAVASTVTTITKTDVNMGTAVAGVAGVNGLQFQTAGAVLSKYGTWSGVNVATGTAGWFRLLAAVADAGAASTTLFRIDGNISTSGANMNLSSTSLTSGATFTLDQFDITLPES